MMGLVTVGCGGTVTPAGDSGPGDAGSGPAQTVTYVLGAINAETPAGSDPTQAYGFNLDGMVGGPAGTCFAVDDFTSPITGMTGVDNQLGGSLAGLLDGVLMGDGLNGTIRDQIEAGKVLLILEVSDINSFTADSSIMVHAVLGQMPAGAACQMHTDMASCTGDTAHMCSFTAGAMGAAGTCATTAAPQVSAACAAHTDSASCYADHANACNWGAMASACSGIASGQTFAMLSDLGTVPGSITGGQISATTSSLPLTFSAMGHVITLTLHNVQFGGRIAATGITNGEFGAKISIAELQSTIDSLGLGVMIATLAPPDISLTDGGTTCDAISAGMEYDAIVATVSN